MPRGRHLTRPMLFAACGLAALHLFGAANEQASAQGQPPSTTAPANPAASSPLDQPLAWLQEGKRNYSAVRDYSCLLVKKENVNGYVSPDNFIQFKFKQPFCVHMKWIAPTDVAGQEVAFVLGANNNKMRVRSNKIGLKVTGFHSIDVDDPRVLQHSRHTIYEAGIGHMIDHTLKLWETEKKLNKTQVKMAEYDFNKRRCIRIETIHPERLKEYYSYRGVIYLDKDSKIPVRLENYDWPRQGGPADGDLLESFSFIDLRFNVGLSDADFRK